MRHLLFAIACGALVSLTGCKSQCRQLSEKLCDCTLNSAEKSTCMQRASSSETNNPPSAEDEATCKQLIADCDCRLIDTPQGKVRCGLARPPAQP